MLSIEEFQKEVRFQLHTRTQVLGLKLGPSPSFLRKHIYRVHARSYALRHSVSDVVETSCRGPLEVEHRACRRRWKYGPRTCAARMFGGKQLETLQLGPLLSCPQFAVTSRK